jgi:hypothetical protein
VGEIGDEAQLGDSGFQFTGISIKYYSNYNLSGGLTLTIYPQTGIVIQASPSPDRSNPLFRITTDIISGNHVLSVGYSLGDFYLPNDFTFALKFDGLSQNNDAGVFLGGRATIGGIESSRDCLSGGGRPGPDPFEPCGADDVWTSSGPGLNDWNLNHIAGGFGNLNAVITGNVPEPGSFSLGILACAAFAGGYAHSIARHRRNIILKYDEHI